MNEHRGRDTCRQGLLPFHGGSKISRAGNRVRSRPLCLTSCKADLNLPGRGPPGSGEIMASHGFHQVPPAQDVAAVAMINSDNRCRTPVLTPIPTVPRLTVSSCPSKPLRVSAGVFPVAHALWLAAATLESLA